MGNRWFFRNLVKSSPPNEPTSHTCPMGAKKVIRVGLFGFWIILHGGHGEYFIPYLNTWSLVKFLRSPGG